jgi:hypothetical protein
MLGLRIRLAASPALAAALDGIIELHLFAGGYAGLLLQEDGGVNLCLSVSAGRLRAAGGSPAALIGMLGREAPLLGERHAAATRAGAWATVARVPYGWRARETVPGLFRVGDQAAVIASLAGDGLGIALASGSAAARSFLRGGADAAPDFQSDFAGRIRRPVRLAEALRRCGERPWLARPLLGLLAHAPGLLARAAAMTRVDADEHREAPGGR